ncbi:FxSxx-COOH system tetratricopeptide repeat protein [Streptomyces sp. LX-29]|uniref:FxSxx-COOH system tetratricopeptide repeat protein n=1 Tax=Streptomyces sp. LX-29 TaxID=2900152 RepID=UPI00240E93E2|nr:FxSxx-COOH system tetratricopeptide repeat protein [Streptomyces sp. LX-29]WFB08482.1 FxSxx-COOH system tetratricopeptide repeat protein [Streptomyces sp. LX-29]
MTVDGSAEIISFYTFKSGAGRTMAVANTAWILASAGKSVLTVDWDLDAPGLHRYYQRFLTDHELSASRGVLDILIEFAIQAGHTRPDELHRLYEDHANLLPFTVQLDAHFAGGGRLDYLGPGIHDGEYRNRMARINWSYFLRQEGLGFLTELRERIRHSGYDYVLINGRTGLSDGADVCTLVLPDSVVLGLTMNEPSTEGCAEVARRIRERAHRDGREIRIHVVPLRVETSQDDRLAHRLTELRHTFGPFVRPADDQTQEGYWSELQIPYHPFYALGEELAVLREDPRNPLGLLSQYVKLTARVSRGAVATFQPTSEQLRRLYNRAYDAARRGVEPETVVLLHAPEDQVWADWIREQLRLIGVRVADRDDVEATPDEIPEQTDAVVVLLSSHLHGSPDGETATRLAEGAPVGRPRSRRTVGVRVSGARLPTRFAWHDAVNLFGLTAQAATVALLSRFGFPGWGENPPPDAAAGPRFPGRLPEVWNLGLRNSAFTGRAGTLSLLRERFGRGVGSPGSAQVLYGMGGVGKSQIALEYAHRFASEYDVVWWVPASAPDNIRTSLTELARELHRASGAPGAPGPGEDLDQLRRDLRLGRPFERWLLILDDAADPHVVRDLLPGTGHGHTLVTSRNSAWNRFAEPARVEEFSPEESLSLMGTRLPTAPEGELARLADALGHLPLAEEQAAAWLQSGSLSVAQFIERVATNVNLLDEGSAPDYPLSFAATYDLAYDRLKKEDPAAAKLLDLCAFLSPDGVSLSVVQSPAMLELLAAVDERLRDSMRLGTVLTSLDRRALAVVDQSTTTVRVHRIVQTLRRARMGEELRERTRREVLGVLASLAPGDVEGDDLRHDATFTELDRHLVVSGALECDEPVVRRWVVNQVRYRWRRGQWASARDLGLRILADWRERFPAEDAAALRLATQIANAHRSLGEYQRAYELDSATLRAQRAALGRDDPYTLMTARGYAADLRALGHFADALVEDQGTLLRFRDVFTDEHPDTAMAANNLALSWYFMGSYRDAVQYGQMAFDVSRRLLTDDHPRTWASYANLGRYHRELGDLESSFTHLREARDRLTEIEGGSGHQTLSTLRSLGVSYLRAGDPNAAVPLLRRAHEHSRDQWGDDHPATMEGALAMAAGLHALDRDDEAADYARKALDRYVRVFGDQHPFTDVCRSNLALYLLDGGLPGEAHGYATDAADQLTRTLGHDHPFTLVARMNFNNCRAALGDLEYVPAEDRKIHAECVRRWDRDHPTALMATANLAASGPPEAAAELRTSVEVRGRDALGAGHPLTRALTALPYRRLGTDVEISSV